MHGGPDLGVLEDQQVASLVQFQGMSSGTSAKVVEIGWRRLCSDNQGGCRIASPELLPSADLLPHVTCSPPMFAGGGGHEADQHDDTRRIGCGPGGAI